MDMNLVASALAAQSASLQTNIAMQVMKTNAKAEKDVVQALLGASSGAPSQANIPAGVGGQVDISA
jgi:hypothetical protein